MLDAPGYVVEPATKVVDVLQFSHFVAERHKNDRRRDGSPYFTHCASVALLALELARDLGEDEVGRSIVEAAGYGHDLFEDTKTDYEDVVKKSCEEVAALISWVSDDKRLPVDLRHKAYLARLAAAPLRAQVIKLADITDNCRDSFGLFNARPAPLRFLRRWQLRAQAALVTLTAVAMLSCYSETSGRLAELARRLDDMGVPLPVD